MFDLNYNNFPILINSTSTSFNNTSFNLDILISNYSLFFNSFYLNLFISNYFFNNFSFYLPINVFKYNLSNYYNFSLVNISYYKIDFYNYRYLKNDFNFKLFILGLNQLIPIKIIPFIKVLVENYNTVEFSKNFFVFNYKIIPSKRLLEINFLVSKEDFNDYYFYFTYSNVFTFYNPFNELIISVLKKEIEIKEYSVLKDKDKVNLISIKGYEWTTYS